MTGAFHEGLREAMAEPANPMVQHIRDLHEAKVIDEHSRAEARVLDEHDASMQRAVEEANEYIVSSEDSIIVGAIADLIAEHPHLFAIRFLRLERQVDELRQQFDASTLGAYVSRETVARAPELYRYQPVGEP